MFSATGGSSSSAKVSRAASASASLSSRAVTALRSAGGSAGPRLRPRRRVVVQFLPDWRPAAWHQIKSCASSVRSLRGGGQRVVLCCRHAIVHPDVSSGWAARFLPATGCQIIRQLGQIGRGAVLATGSSCTEGGVGRAQRVAGWASICSLSPSARWAVSITTGARLPGRWIAAGKLAGKRGLPGKIQSIGLISDFRQRFAARWRSRASGTGNAVAASRAGDHVQHWPAVHQQKRPVLPLAGRGRLHRQGASSCASTGGASITAVVLGTGQQFANKASQFFAGRRGRPASSAGASSCASTGGAIDLAVVLGTGQQFINKSDQFFAGQQGRRCFISGRPVLAPAPAVHVDLAVVLGTGQQFTDKASSSSLAGRTGAASQCRQTANQQQKARSLAQASVEAQQVPHCACRQRPAEDARKAALLAPAEPACPRWPDWQSDGWAKALKAGRFCEVQYHIQRDRLRTGGRRGRSRHDEALRFR